MCFMLWIVYEVVEVYMLLLLVCEGLGVVLLLVLLW